MTESTKIASLDASEIDAVAGGELPEDGTAPIWFWPDKWPWIHPGGD